MNIKRLSLPTYYPGPRVQEDLSESRYTHSLSQRLHALRMCSPDALWMLLSILDVNPITKGSVKARNTPSPSPTWKKHTEMCPPCSNPPLPSVLLYNHICLLTILPRVLVHSTLMVINGVLLVVSSRPISGHISCFLVIRSLHDLDSPKIMEAHGYPAANGY